MASEWDRIGEEERGKVLPFPEPPAYMDEAPPYEEERGDPPLVLTDPASWAGTEPPPRRWRAKDYIPDGQATLLTGKGGAGKSLVSQLLCTCMAMHLPFLGIETDGCNALYVTCEDDQDELQRRQAAICEGLGIDASDLSGKLFLLSLQGEIGNELATFTHDGRMSVAALYRRLSAVCLTHSIRFLVLDNTAHLFTGNENDRHQVAAFLNLCNRLAREIGGAVIIVGHPNKNGDSYSGSTAWENQVRSRLFMEIPISEDGEAPDPDIRVMRREKVNYAQRGGELRFMWYRGSFVLPDEVPQTGSHSLGLTASDARDNELFMTCLKVRNSQKRAVSEQKASPTYAPKQFADMAESRGIGRARLERAMDRLFRIGAIERGFLWVYVGEGRSAHGLRIVNDGNGSDDVPMTSNRKKMSNKINPMTSDDLGEAEGAEDHTSTSGGRHREIVQNQPDNLPMTSSDDVPMTSDDLTENLPMTSDDTHPIDTTYLSGGLSEAGPPDDDGSDPGEPPGWMDDAPPHETDWRESPAINPDWSE